MLSHFTLVDDCIEGFDDNLAVVWRYDMQRANSMCRVVTPKTLLSGSRPE